MSETSHPLLLLNEGQRFGFQELCAYNEHQVFLGGNRKQTCARPRLDPCGELSPHHCLLANRHADSELSMFSVKTISPHRPFGEKGQIPLGITRLGFCFDLTS